MIILFQRVPPVLHDRGRERIRVNNKVSVCINGGAAITIMPRHIGNDKSCGLTFYWYAVRIKCQDLLQFGSIFTCIFKRTFCLVARGCNEKNMQKGNQYKNMLHVICFVLSCGLLLVANIADIVIVPYVYFFFGLLANLYPTENMM